MTTRDHAPAGAPNWIDLWTSDVEGSRRFYPALFGWEALEANPDFGGYFQFAHDGHPIAGAMGDMADMKADDTWKCYFQTSDIERAAAAVVANGGTLHGPPMPVADLGIQCVFSDPSGAVTGAWQPGTFHGFHDLEVPNTPSWFELHTRDHAAPSRSTRRCSGGTSTSSATPTSSGTRWCATPTVARWASRG